MKIICISDTHNKHRQLNIPKGDVLVHAGDISEGGTKREIIDFLDWFSTQPHEHKIFIAGNHDFYLEKLDREDLKKLIPENLQYLENSGVTIQGVKFWGISHTQNNGQWAFNLDNCLKTSNPWNEIPSNTNVLITHSPPYKINDLLKNGEHIGNASLYTALNKININFHIFGHVHDAYGITQLNNTQFINASSIDNKHQHFNEPLSITIKTLK